MRATGSLELSLYEEPETLYPSHCMCAYFYSHRLDGWTSVGAKKIYSNELTQLLGAMRKILYSLIDVTRYISDGNCIRDNVSKCVFFIFIFRNYIRWQLLISIWIIDSDKKFIFVCYWISYEIPIHSCWLFVFLWPCHRINRNWQFLRKLPIYLVPWWMKKN